VGAYDLSPADRQLLKQLGRQHDALRELLTRMRAAEVERLCQTSTELFSTLKGRVQMLTELRQLIEP
jgi:hypothetical protein